MFQYVPRLLKLAGPMILSTSAITRTLNGFHLAKVGNRTAMAAADSMITALRVPDIPNGGWPSKNRKNIPLTYSRMLT